MTWIKCKASFRPHDMLNSTYESLPEEEQEKAFEWRPFRFRPESVLFYYPSGESSPSESNIVVTGDVIYCLDLTISELDAIFEEENKKQGVINRN